MRILALCMESYPAGFASSFVLMHQSMALEDMGHEVHWFNVRKPPLRLSDFLEAHDFDLIFADIELFRDEDLRLALHDFRNLEPIRFVASILTLPPPPQEALDLADFAVTPWKGRSIELLSRDFDIRYLPLGYNRKLHRRTTDLQPIGPVFVGNTTGARASEAENYLQNLMEERYLLCIGPGYPQKYLDPFILGRVYTAARCVPNFHYRGEKEDNRILNERFWQTARCGIPVNDRPPLAGEIWEEPLLQAFCIGDEPAWKDRIRGLHQGTVRVEPALLDQLDKALEGNSYHDRMALLLSWLD